MAPDPKPKIFGNRLLSVLSEDHLALLAPHLTTVDLELRQELEWSNKPIEQVYFIR